MQKPTIDEVEKLLTIWKQLLRSTDWAAKVSRKKPTRWLFESACTIGTTDTSDIFFRAEHRPACTITRGISVIEMPELTYVGLFIGEHRVCAIDSNPEQHHTNSVGIGRPYFRQTVSSATHLHIWTMEGEGYVEPIEPPILLVEDIFTDFFTRVNLLLKGEFIHPLKNKQMEITGTWTALNSSL